MSRNIIQIFFSRGLIALINFTILLITARYLGPSTRAEISVFLLNCLILQAICETYTGIIVVDYLDKFNFNKLLIGGLKLIIVVCLVGFVVFSLFDKLVKGYELHFAILFLLVILNSFACNLLLGLKKIKTYTIVSVLQPLLLAVGLLFFIKYLNYYTFASYVYPIIFSFCITIALNIYVLFKSEKNTGADYSFKEIIEKGYYTQLLLLTLFLVNRYNFYFMKNSNELGVYSISTTIGEAFLLVSGSVAPIVITSFKSVFDSENRVQITKLTIYSLTFVMFCSLLVYVLPSSVFSTVFSFGFSDLKDKLFAYLPSVFFLAIIKILFYYFLVESKLQLIVKWFVLGLVTVLTASPTLCNLYGYKGAALCSTIGYFIILLGLFWTYRKERQLI